MKQRYNGKEPPCFPDRIASPASSASLVPTASPAPVVSGAAGSPVADSPSVQGSLQGEENREQKSVELVAQLSLTMDRLSELLDRESAIVTAHGTRELEQIYREKVTLHAEYIAALERIRAFSGGKKLPLSEAVRRDSHARAQRLAASMKQNQLKVGIAAEASRCIVDMIIAAVRQQRTGVTGYGLSAKGTLTGAEGNAQAVTLDKRL